MAHLVDSGGAAGQSQPVPTPGILSEAELEDLGSISSALSLVSPNEKQFDLIANRLKKLLDEDRIHCPIAIFGANFVQNEAAIEASVFQRT